MRKLLKVLWVLARAGIGVLLFCMLFPLALMANECRYIGGGPSRFPPQNAVSQTEAMREAKKKMPNYARLEDQTYLTLPEWYIVYSAEEYATFIESNPPSRFPYLGSIWQYWDSTYRICGVTRDKYPLNSGYHIMLAVIGPSYTAEYLVKGAYENTFGRLTELIGGGARTPEDDYAAAVGKDYGRFIHTIPWYDYPFGEKLRGLWTSTTLLGPNPVRKLERKFALSMEYGFKAIYGAAMSTASTALYGELETQVFAIAEGVSEEMLAREPELKLIGRVDESQALVALPHYEAFTQLVPRLTRQGMRFVEIGDSDEIMLTALAPSTWVYNVANSELLFSLALPTDHNTRRLVINVPVEHLHNVLAKLEAEGARLEHLYDY